MPDHERRYTRDELAAILDAADEPGRRDAKALQRRAGLTLGEIEAIAAEVGVAPGAIARAARHIPLGAESDLARLCGGPARVQLAFSLAGTADAAMQDRVIEAIRRLTGEQGSLSHSQSGMEWRNATVAVNLVVAAEETRVHIVADRHATAAILGSVTTIVAGVAVGVTGAILEPTGVLPVTTLVLGIGAVAALTGRTIWARSTASFRRMLARLTDGVADAVPGAQQKTEAAAPAEGVRSR